MKELTYKEVFEELDKIDAPAQRLGIFDVKINNRGKKYHFKSLKQNSGGVIGFGLNHYGWLNLPMPKYKRSRFHDEEDVSVDIYENEFISCTKVNNTLNNTLNIKAKTFNAVITW